MQNMEEIKARYAEAEKTKISGQENWRKPRTRDEMITHFETDWDKIKNFWAANPKTAAGTLDAFNLKSFDNFLDWKNWFMEQHPENEILTTENIKFNISPTTPKRPSTSFDIRKPNFNNTFLPKRTADLISQSGIDTVWDNPFFGKLFKRR